MAVLDELATHLATQLSLTVGTNLFKGSMPASPDTCVVITEYGGSPPVIGFGNTTGVAIEYPHVQVRVREQRRTTPPRETPQTWRGTLSLKCKARRSVARTTT